MRIGFPVLPNFITTPALAALLLLGIMMSAAPAKPPGGGGGGGGGAGGAGAAGSGTATGPTAPAQPIAFGFPAFFIVADGAEPNFQTYATELIARDFVNSLLKSDITSKTNIPRNLPFALVATTGWTEDTLNQACQNDPANFAGALVVKFTSFLTDANWLVFNTETQHVTPSFFFAGCRDTGTMNAQKQEVYTLVHLTPTINIHTVKSRAQWTIPVAPVTALATLFTFKGNSNAAYQVKYGILLGVTALGGLAGNFGVLNPGHEALSAASEISHNATMLTLNACNIKHLREYDAPGLQTASPPIELLKVLPTPVPAVAPASSPPQLGRTPPMSQAALCSDLKAFGSAVVDAQP